MTDLTIHKVVIHALVKDQHKPIQPSVLRETVLDRTHVAVIKTVTGVVDIYGTRNNSSQYGIFATREARGSFPGAFETYFGHPNPGDDEFLTLTRNAMQRLFDKASANQASSGGNLLFADYSSLQGRYFLIAMIKQKPGITLSATLEPAELMHLDLSKLHQAVRISFSKLTEFQGATEAERQELNYLSFISPGSVKAASGYFVNAIGCTAGAAAAQATTKLITESKRFFAEDTRLRPHKESFQNSLMEYLKGKDETGRSVRLSEVEHIARSHFPEELADDAEELADALITRLNSEEIGVPVEFPVSSRALKKFTHIVGEGPSWKMSFSRSALGTEVAAEVYYDRDNNRVTLSNIPPSMREVIESELNERNDE